MMVGYSACIPTGTFIIRKLNRSLLFCRKYWGSALPNNIYRYLLTFTIFTSHDSYSSKGKEEVYYNRLWIIYLFYVTFIFLFLVLVVASFTLSSNSHMETIKYLMNIYLFICLNIESTSRYTMFDVILCRLSMSFSNLWNEEYQENVT
jgi:hypothetical protein